MGHSVWVCVINAWNWLTLSFVEKWVPKLEVSYPRFDTDIIEDPVYELCGVYSIPSLSLISYPLGSTEEEFVTVISMDQIHMFKKHFNR